MNRKSPRLLGLALAAGLGVASLATTPVIALQATSAPETAPTESPAEPRTGEHDLSSPLEDKRRALRQEALAQVINGEATPEKRGKSTVVKVSDSRTSPAVNEQGRQTQTATSQDQYVELEREATDRIFVVLAEFGDRRHPDYPDKDLEPAIAGPATFEGPQRNKIPEPDRSVDNSTVWQPDYDQEHFQDLYFGEGGEPGSGGEVESVKQYYERQSSGRYSIDGTVTDWVKVRFNGARYGRSSDDPANGDDPAVCADVVCNNTWNLVQDAVNQWVKDQRAAGRTPREIVDELKTFDVWDRYDADGDGNFNEPDGYIDHFQVVHAGGDEADGDDQQGEDAIWSHRWYVQTTPIGTGGPADNPAGGTQIGGTGLWVGDYTIQPENGGMSVFAHEYGHDLGLPDLYDTAGGRNGVNFWSMMAQSRTSAPEDQGIGTRGADFGTWEKLQLGWLDYETVLPSQNRTIELGPHEFNTDKAQAAVVVLPKKTQTTELVEPFAGARSWWSGTGDDLANTMSRPVELPAGEITMSMQANYDVETDYDYAYVEVNDGSGWVTIPGSITGDINNGIDGTSDGWVPATFDLSAYAGNSVSVRLRYQTDGAVAGNDPAKADGFFADDITLTAGGQELLNSGAEASPEGWTLDGFSSAADSFTQEYDNFYLASHRVYVSFDKYLQSGPYNFGDPASPKLVEHFPYQDGLLINYWDTTQTDNNTSVHPGQGLIMPIDANPRPIVQLNGEFWRPRIAGYDAPFSKEKSDSFFLDVDGEPNYIRGQKAQPLFRDSRQYWFESQPSTGVKVPDNGVDIRVKKQDGTSMTIKVSQRR